MKTSNTYSATMDDIIFEQRNMSYGAYMIRKKYPQRVYISLLFTIGVFTFFVAIPGVLKYFNGDEGVTKVSPVIDTEVVLGPKPDIILEDVQPPSGSQKAPETTSNAALVPTVTDKPEEDTTALAKNDSIPETGSGNTIGQANAGVGEGPASGPGSTGTGDALVPQKVDSIVSYADEMPSFPALSKFLQRNLRYPSKAVERQIEGYVYLSFVVSRDGSLKDFKILRGISKECDEEAMRVARKMPNWKPGKFHGQPVSVRYSLPIKYVLNN